MFIIRVLVESLVNSALKLYTYTFSVSPSHGSDSEHSRSAPIDFYEKLDFYTRHDTSLSGYFLGDLRKKSQNGRELAPA